jgi:hypothetical protein
MRAHRHPRRLQALAFGFGLLAALPVQWANANQADVRLFLGVTHQALGSSDQTPEIFDRRVRAFIAVQKLLDEIDEQLPSDLSKQVGDVVSWPADRRGIEERGFTHYLVAEPRLVTEDDAPAIAVRWHIGAFSVNPNRALDGFLKEREGVPRRVVLLPKVQTNKDYVGSYEEAIFTQKDANGRRGPASVGGVAEELIKILNHVIPELRRGNRYFIECIEEGSLKGVNADFMSRLSARLETKGWSPVVPLLRSQAEDICNDKKAYYKENPSLRFEDADFLIRGWFSSAGNKVRPELLIENRTAWMRQHYLSRPGVLSDSSESLSEFCVEPTALLQPPVMKTLVEYIHSHGFKAGQSKPLHEDWKCPP